MTPLATRFGRFGLVGVLGAILQLLLLSLLTKYIDVDGVMATPVAVEIAILHNFMWHERFTWKVRSSPGIRKRIVRLLRFHAANGLISLVGNTVLMYFLVDRLQAPIPSAAILAIALCALANFFVADRWVYASER